MEFLKSVFEKVNFEKYQQTTKMFPSMHVVKDNGQLSDEVRDRLRLRQYWLRDNADLIVSIYSLNALKIGLWRAKNSTRRDFKMLISALNFNIYHDGVFKRN